MAGILVWMALLVYAHAGPWLWALYVPPMLVVFGSIIRVKLSERRDRD